jgi:hypothetical protein
MVSTAALQVPPDFRFDRHRCAEAQLQEINSCRNHLRMLAMSSPPFDPGDETALQFAFRLMPRRFADGATPQMP